MAGRDAKIEKTEASTTLDEIVTETQAVMVARGDLGVDIGAAEGADAAEADHPGARSSAKPVITATQMLERMENEQPTRAEACDVANAILDVLPR